MLKIIEEARNLIVRGYPIDAVLGKLDITQKQYREQYPDTPVTPALTLDILECYCDLGHSRKKIMEDFNLTRGKLHYALYNKKASMLQSRKNYDFVKILEMLKQNHTQQDIAKKFNISNSTVSLIAKKNKLSPKRKKYKRLSEREKEKIRIECKTKPVSETAKKYNVAGSTIYKMLCQ